MALHPLEVATVRQQGDLPTRASVLKNALVVKAITRSEAAAEVAERRGRLLEAQELYYRLNMLLDEDRRYQDHVDRVAKRLGLVRFYAPEKFLEIRNDYLKSQGEDAQPAYEDDPTTWKSCMSRKYI